MKRRLDFLQSPNFCTVDIERCASYYYRPPLFEEALLWDMEEFDGNSKPTNSPKTPSVRRLFFRISNLCFRMLFLSNTIIHMPVLMCVLV
jgi:hypothetical protein